MTTPLISITLPTLVRPPLVVVWSGMGLLERRFRVMAPGAEAPAKRRESIRAQTRAIRLLEPVAVERRGHPGRVVEASDVRRDAIRQHQPTVALRPCRDSANRISPAATATATTALRIQPRSAASA